jgi:ankyrin repeat protein
MLLNCLFQKEQTLKQKTKIFYLIFYGCTSLIHAIMFGHLNIVEFLISKGANIEAKDKNIILYYI